MAGYQDTRELIINTLLGRPTGTEIQPENHQEYALSMLDYIRSVELTSGGSLIGVAQSETIPIQPENAKVSYIAVVGENTSVTFQNFHGSDGSPIVITAQEGEGYLVTFIWNTEYWEYVAAKTTATNQTIIEHASFFYTGFLNITREVPLPSGYYTLPAAITALINLDIEDDEKSGMLVTFEVSAGSWRDYRFNGSNLSDFYDYNYWIPWGSSTGAGYTLMENGTTLSLTEEYLNANYPNLLAGDEVYCINIDTMYKKITSNSWVEYLVVKTKMS